MTKLPLPMSIFRKDIAKSMMENCRKNEDGKGCSSYPGIKTTNEAKLYIH